jgi:hypothetical protein
LKDEKLKEWMERKKMEKKNEFIYAAFGSAVKISQNLAHRIYEGFAKTRYPVIRASVLEIDDDNVHIKQLAHFKKYSFLELKSINCIYI